MKLNLHFLSYSGSLKFWSYHFEVHFVRPVHKLDEYYLLLQKHMFLMIPKNISFLNLKIFIAKILNTIQIIFLSEILSISYYIFSFSIASTSAHP